MTEQTPSQPRNFYRTILSGSAWTVAARWGQRVIGLISTVVLARLLTPDDFGVAGMAALSLGFIAAFTQMGLTKYIIRTPNPAREVYDTVWTIEVLRGLLVAAVLAGAAPLMAAYFNEPRIVELIYVVAVTTVVTGLMNVGVVQFRKELQFAKDFRFDLYGKLATAAVTIALAVWLRSYWALALGGLAGAALQVAISYTMSGYRPRFSLKEARPVIDFAIPNTLALISRYLNGIAPRLIVGRIEGTGVFGLYHIASDVGAMTSGQILSILNRSMLPNFAKAREEADDFGEIVRRSVGGMLLLAAPVAFGMSAVAYDFVLLVFGAKWLGAVPLLEWIALFAFFGGLLQFLSGNLGLYPGGERHAMILGWSRLAVLVPVAAYAGITWGYQAIPVAGTAVVVAFLPLFLWCYARLYPVTMLDLVGVVWRPLLAAAAMFAAVRAAHVETLDWVALRLLIDVAVGVVSYAVLVMALWLISGRPRGLEALVVGYFARRTGTGGRGSARPHDTAGNR